MFELSDSVSNRIFDIILQCYAMPSCFFVLIIGQMWFYNFVIHIVAKNVERTTFCTWTEDMADRGSSEICSCLLRCIEVDDELRKKIT